MTKDGEHDHVHSTHSHTHRGDGERERLGGEIPEGTNNKMYTSKNHCYCSTFSDYVPSTSGSLRLNSLLY